jgi:hypothetical protein
MLLRESQFEHVTDLFYEAAAIPELMPQALQRLAESCQAAGAVRQAALAALINDWRG